MKKLIAIFVSLVLLSGFQCSNKELNKTLPIVIIDGSGMSRKDLSYLLSEVIKCSPDIIGIDYLFKDSRPEVDSTFAQLIRNFGNVILIADYKNKEVIKSTELIATAAKASAPGGLVKYEGDDQVLYVDETIEIFDPSSMEPFPNCIFTFSRFGDLSRSVKIDPIKINFEYSLDDFIVLNSAEVKSVDFCMKLEDKIVLIGDINKIEASSSTPLGEHTDNLVIYANIILEKIKNIQGAK